jgi:hypothetical protein
VLENAGAFMGDGGGGGLIEVTEQGRARKRKSDRIFAKTRAMVGRLCGNLDIQRRQRVGNVDF